MNAMLRWTASAVALLMGLVAQGQTCYESTLTFSSNLPAGGPTVLYVTLSTADGAEIMPMLPVTVNPEAGTWQETFCLFPGCYVASVYADMALSPELLDFSWSAFGEEQDVTVDIGDATNWYTFCVSSEVMSDCPEAIDYVAADGCLGVFEIGSFVEGESVAWNFGDGTPAVEGGHYTTHAYAENGTYAVTAWYTSSTCPDGVALEAEVAITGCGEACQFEGAVTPLGCGIAQLNGYGLPEGAQPTWYLNGEYVGAGQEILLDGLAPEEGVQCYEVVGYAETECGLATSTFDFCMEACGAECPLEMEAYTMDGMWWQFMAIGPPEGTALDWFIDGNLITTNETGTFEAGFDFNPYWEVCVQYAAQPCEGVVEACFNNMGGSGCPEPIAVEPLDGCNYLLLLGDGNPNAIVEWTVDEAYYDSTEGTLELSFPEGGVHVVTGYYVSNMCPGETYTVTIEATGCTEGCDPVANAVQNDCDSFVLWAAGVPEGAGVSWTLDGEPYEAGLEFAYTVTDMECHVFAYTIQSGACEGAEAEVQICPTDCGDCAAEVLVDEVSPGVYVFTAVTADGALYTGPTNWWIGAELVATGNPAAYTWYDGAPEAVNVCAGLPAWEGCAEPSELCFTMNPVAPECEEVTLSLDVNLEAGIEAVLPWLIAAEVVGVDLAGLDLAGEWIWEVNEGAFEVTFCLPPACFDLVLDWSGTVFDPLLLETWSLEVLLGELTAGTFDNLSTFEGLVEFGMEEGCGPMFVGTPDGQAKSTFFPNPATQTFTCTAPATSTLRVLGGTGALVWSGRPGTVDASSWSPGLYFAELTDAAGRREVHPVYIVR